LVVWNSVSFGLEEGTSLVLFVFSSVSLDLLSGLLVCSSIVRVFCARSASSGS
jgi:hypothetical protein